MVGESAFGTFAVAGRLVAFLRGMHDEVAPFALFDWFGLSWDAEGDLLSEKEVAGLYDLFDLVTSIVVYHDQHGVGLSCRVFDCSAGPH